MKLVLAYLLLPLAHCQDQRYTPGSTANILEEQYLDSLSFQSSLISITSDVPVTLQKYSDTSQSFLMGSEPVPQNLGMVIVTSDCSSEETSVVPEITVDGDSITVNLGVDGQGMGFLQETTRYETFWSYVYGMCGFNYFGYTSSTELNVDLIEGTDAPVGSRTEAPAVSEVPTSAPSANVTFITEATQASTGATDETTPSSSGTDSGYDSCGFNCCSNSDCVDSCCVEGVCQEKENEFDLCAEPPIKPSDEGGCGAVAYKNFQVEGNCPTGYNVGGTVPGEPVTTAFSTTTTTTGGMDSGSTATVATIDRTTTTPEPQDPNPCAQGKCLGPDGECAISVMCLNDPCQAEDNGCGDGECITNYCGGCNAICVGISTSEINVFETTTTGPTDANTTTETASTSASSIDPTFPEPSPTTDSPTEVPSQESTAAQTSNTEATNPQPMTAVDETEPTPTPPTDTRPSFEQYQNPDPPTPSQPSPGQPTIVVINVPVQTVPVPAPGPVDNEGTAVETQATESITSTTDEVEGDDSLLVDILDTPNPSTSSVMSMSMHMSVELPSPAPTFTSTDAGSTSPAPSYDSANRFVDASREEVGSSGFSARNPFYIRLAVTFIAVIMITLLFPQESTSHTLFGASKIVVAAVVVSAVLTRSEKGNVRGKASPQFGSRNLQDTCTYNVELLYDGCTKNVQVDAPAARVIDVLMEDYNSETNAEDECRTDYSANLTFPASNSTEVNLTSNATIPTYSYSDWQCLRAIEGRPFTDVRGKGILATPRLAESCVGEMKVEWSGEAYVDTPSPAKNITNSNQIKLGNEWVGRALGEHSSIASFSAFAIALMTNAAPSSLVEDSLKAGLDEVRHARTSFDIASKLLGKNVEPSSLPESKHEFDQDLSALALALAREGCVDETLSALAAAAEVGAIERMLQGSSVISKYSGVSSDLLRYIADELETITLDEINHSALAWRSLKWVCSTDSNACNVAEREVFDDLKLNMRFQQRAEGDEELFDLMKSEWQMIYTTFKLGSRDDKQDIHDTLVSKVAEKVMRVLN